MTSALMNSLQLWLPPHDWSDQNFSMEIGRTYEVTSQPKELVTVNGMGGGRTVLSLSGIATDISVP